MAVICSVHHPHAFDFAFQSHQNSRMSHLGVATTMLFAQGVLNGTVGITIVMENTYSSPKEKDPVRALNMTEETIYKIGDLAREFDVTLRTLRFYEDRGLINPARSGTTRLYSEEDRERLRIALFCKRIGLSLGDIRQVLELHDRSDADDQTSKKIRKVYASQLRALERQQEETRNTIADLQNKLAELDKAD